MASLQNEAIRDAIVVGGSLSGLMNAIILRHAGYKVNVLERSHPSQLYSESAGLGVGPNMHALIEKYMPAHEDYAIKMTEYKLWSEQAKIQEKRALPYPLRMTNWRTIYDMLKNALMIEWPDLPPPTYQTNMEVFDVRGGSAGVSARYRDLETGAEEDLQTSFLIAADGANSSVRRKLWQDVSPSYVGYVIWRGRVPEGQVSRQTREALQNKAVFQRLDNGYMLSYLVPTESEEVRRDPKDRRDIFWAFYDNVEKDSLQLKETMTDVDGNVHHNTITKNKIQPGVWQEAMGRIKLQACPFYGELMGKTTQLHVSAIQDFPNTKAIFCDGKVILAGDAMSQCRPHAGGGLNENAFQALELEKVLKGASTLLQWEEICMESAAKARALAIDMGKGFLPPGTIP